MPVPAVPELHGRATYLLRELRRSVPTDRTRGVAERSPIAIRSFARDAVRGSIICTPFEPATAYASIVEELGVETLALLASARHFRAQRGRTRRRLTRRGREHELRSVCGQIQRSALAPPPRGQLDRVDRLVVVHNDDALAARFIGDSCAVLVDGDPASRSLANILGFNATTRSPDVASRSSTSQSSFTTADVVCRRRSSQYLGKKCRWCRTRACSRHRLLVRERPPPNHLAR